MKYVQLSIKKVKGKINQLKKLKLINKNNYLQKSQIIILK
jgi:hypothetical protein